MPVTKTNLRSSPVCSILALAAASLASVVSPAFAHQSAEPAFVQDSSDLKADERVVYGELENGLRYAVMRNATPSGAGAIRMRIDTGSWDETDAQQGIAHFLEHMAFNGSTNVPEGEMVKRLERYGLAFGADTNASTGFDQTVYKLNLPNVGEELLDEAFFLMRETASNLLLDEEAIDRERGVIASEKSSRDSLGFRSAIDNLGFFTKGSGRIDRLPIGTDETIATMPREEFVRFYEGYYRPENTFIVFVGDVETDLAIAKIREYFGDWKPASPAAEKRPLTPAATEAGRIGYYQDPELLTFITIGTQYPYELQEDSADRRREYIVRTIGNRILDRRLTKLVDEGKAPFLSGSVTRYAQREIVDGMLIRVRSATDKWQESLAVGDLEVRRALEFGFSQAELDEQLALYRRSLETAVERKDTRKTFASFEYNYVDALASAFAADRVFTSPDADLALFEDLERTISVEQVETAFREAWSGYETPSIYLSTSLELDDPEARIAQALKGARKVAPEAPPEQEIAAFAFTDFGTPGEVVSETYVEDADAYLVKFANNVRLNLKQTPFDNGNIYIQANIGDGYFSMPAGKDEGFRRLAENLLSRSGVGPHTSSDLRTMFAGKRVGARPYLRTDGDAIRILGATDSGDLGEQLNLMAAYAVEPSYRDTIEEQYFDQMRAWYPTHDSEPASVISKYVPRLVRSGDPRYGYGDLDSFLAPTLEEVREWLDPQLKQGLVEITVVGDFDREEMIAQVARTFGALPTRADSKGDYSEAHMLDFPERPDEVTTLYHNGTPDQAIARVYWPAPDGTDPVVRYQLNALRSIFRNRMTKVLREELGSTYSPGAGVEADPEFPGYGYMVASVTVFPDAARDVLPDIEKVGSDLAAGPIDEDELQRAITPLLEDLPSTLEDNSYWIGVLGDAQTGGRGLLQFRTREDAYRSVTVDDLQALAREIFQRENAFPVLVLPSREDDE
ncbi:M16 family metallopeptidase [Pseudoblastomonas halimionae]|nr:M16 family metallopeptidase [Alteriqipengyuania halimionae]